MAGSRHKIYGRYGKRLRVHGPSSANLRYQTKSLYKNNVSYIVSFPHDLRSAEPLNPDVVVKRTYQDTSVTAGSKRAQYWPDT